MTSYSLHRTNPTGTKCNKAPLPVRNHIFALQLIYPFVAPHPPHPQPRWLRLLYLYNKPGLFAHLPKVRRPMTDRPMDCDVQQKEDPASLIDEIGRLSGVSPNVRLEEYLSSVSDFGIAMCNKNDLCLAGLGLRQVRDAMSFV